MGGSEAAETPVPPDVRSADGLRASDADRDEVANRLRDEYVAGRLSHDTFLYRMDAVLAAKQVSDLPPLLTGLPALPPGAQPPGAQPAGAQAPGARPADRHGYRHDDRAQAARPRPDHEHAGQH